MKNILTLITIALLLSSCHSRQVRFSRLEYNDRLFSKVRVEFEVDWPDQGDKRVCNSIREWISESLGGTYDGDMSHKDSLLFHYADENILYLQKISGASEDQELVYKCHLHAVAEGEDYITMVKDIEEDAGGAHSFGSTMGATFRKSDGRRFSIDLFKEKSVYTLQSMIKDSLDVYFSRMDTIRLSQIYDENEEIPLPLNPPFIIDDKIVFQYQEYEIGSWAESRPKVSFCKEDVTDLLTMTAKELLGDKRH